MDEFQLYYFKLVLKELLQLKSQEKVAITIENLPEIIEKYLESLDL